MIASPKVVNATIEILNKYYSIRCPESELSFLQEAATHLNQKMLEVQESGKAINLERIAIISGLNIAYQLLEAERQNADLIQHINQRVNQLQDKVQAAINKTVQTELIYSPDEEITELV